MKKFCIVLVGQPNVGKSSLINAISGAKLRVGNFSGVTVEKAEANLNHKDYHINIIDLPGTYSLSGYTLDEKVCKDFLASGQYDIILNVLDSTNLERNLVLTLQLKKLEKPVFLALNMIDEAQKDNIQINLEKLKNIIKCPVCAVSSTNNQNLDVLLDSLVEFYESISNKSDSIHDEINEKGLEKTSESLESANVNSKDFIDLPDFENQRNKEAGFLESNNENLKKLDPKSNNQKVKAFIPATNVAKPSPNFAQFSKDPTPTSTIKWTAPSSEILNAIKMTSKIALNARQIAGVVQILPPFRARGSAKIDLVILNKFLAIPIFLLSMFIVFQLTFYVGSFFQDYIDSGIDFLATSVKEWITNDTLASLLSDGVIKGVGAPLSFLPLIATLFLGLTLLEASGYMARIAFLLDGIFVRFGLHGKSFIPLVMGFGCSVPAYMATRTLQNNSDRLITLFVIGFMSCSARLPIYLLFIGAFFPVNYAGSILFAIYLSGIIVGLICAKILKLTAFKGSNEPFAIEMPRYRVPSLRVVWFSVWSKCYMFLKKAGSVILVGAILIWVIATYPRSSEIDSKYDSKIKNITALDSSADSKDSKATPKDSKDSESKDEGSKEDYKTAKIKKYENDRLQEQLEYSIAGRVGHSMQPFFTPLGFDWRLSVALLTGFSAKEMVVATLGVLYALGDAANDDDNTNKALQAILQKNVTFPSAVAFIIFIMLYIPCFAASIAFAHESGKKIYVVYLLIFTTAVAYFFAFIGYEVAKVLL